MAVTLQSLTERYTQRVIQLRKQRNIFLAIAIPLLVVIAFYFRYSYNQFKKLTTPSSLVDYGYSATMTMLPKTLDSMSDYMVFSAPEMVDSTFNTLADQLPVLRELTQDTIDSMLAHDLNVLEEAFNVYLLEIFAHHDAEVMAMAKSSNPAEVQALSDRLKVEIRSRFDSDMNKKLEEFHKGLKKINAELDQLAKAKPGQLTPDQELEMKVLGLWKKTVEKYISQ